MKECKNPTCTQQTKSTYCDRRCQLAMRTVSKGHQIPDMWVGMNTWRALTAAAERQGLDVRDFVAALLDSELEKTGQLVLL